jgi:hypothetical protein
MKPFYSKDTNTGKTVKITQAEEVQDIPMEIAKIEEAIEDLQKQRKVLIKALELA